METRIETSAASAVQGGTFYRAVILSAQDIFTNADINDRNEVAFDIAGTFTGYFYDGNTVYDTGLGSVRALNDRGQVIGSANVPETGALHAYLWSLSTGLVHLEPAGPPPGESAARDINNRGQVVGATSVDSGPSHAAFWDADGSVLDLGTFGGVFSEAMAINDAGEVTGHAQDAAANLLAFIWTEDDGMRGIGTLGGPYSTAIDINAAGEIAGTSSDVFEVSKPFFWSRRDGMIGIGIGGYATDINDRGMVVGVETSIGQDRAFAWTREAGLAFLGTFGGGSVAVRVNNSGQVIGSAQSADGPRAFVWSRREGLVDLNTRVVDPPVEMVLTYARAISDSGAIVASSTAGLVLLLPCQGRSCRAAGLEK